MERPELPQNDRSIVLSWTEEGYLKIRWRDGHESVYSPHYLRRICPCAYCRVMPRDEKGKPRILLMSNLTIRDVKGVGNYAISFTFSDGHHYGIYPYPYLRSACPCPECQSSAGGDSS